MSAALPPTVQHASAVGLMSKERVLKGIEKMWCRASKSARRDGKFAANANAATLLQYASAGDSPATTLLYFTLGIKYFSCSSLIVLPFTVYASTSYVVHRDAYARI